MKQDLFDWLNSTHIDDTQNISGTGGLLLAPVHNALPENPDNEDNAPSQAEASNSEEIAVQEDEVSHDSREQAVFPDSAAHSVTTARERDHGNPLPRASSTTHPPANPDTSPRDSITAFTDAWQGEAPKEEISIEQDNSQQEPEAQEPEVIIDASDAEDTLQPEEPSDIAQPDEDHASILNQAWHEATGFHINFDEPPPQMWTDIDDEDSDDDDKDYEENPSLQGDAYIPVVKHGANFTQRLQATLKGRKDRAAKQHERESENASSHPYVQKAVIFCGVLLMALGFAYFGLWFINRETPDKLSERAQSLYEQGKYDEAATLYQRGYRRYPEILTFLTGLARSSEKIGRTQTAIAAWNEYMSSLPKDDAEHRRIVQEELARLIPGGEKHPDTQTITLPQKVMPSVTQAKPQMPSLPNVRAMTFDEALSEANSAFNIGMFSRAITNFHKAHSIRPDDIRPYVGLAASYRAKGLYFDAKRMLDEAVSKFGNDPALEIERYYLRRE